MTFAVACWRGTRIVSFQATNVDDASDAKGRKKGRHGTIVPVVSMESLTESSAEGAQNLDEPLALLPFSALPEIQLGLLPSGCRGSGTVQSVVTGGQPVPAASAGGRAASLACDAWQAAGGLHQAPSDPQAASTRCVR